MSEEVVYLSADNADEVLSEFTATYYFTPIAGRPRAAFIVKSASVGRINRWQKASKRGNQREIWNATCELIADSVIDQHGEHVWTTTQIKNMSRANSLRFNDLMLAVLEHNGLNRSTDDSLERLVEDEEKNLDETE